MTMRWVRAIEAATVTRDGMAGAVAGEHRVAVYCVEGAFFATSDVCTHGQAQLSDGYLDGHLIECPLHQGMFDVRTGAAAAAPCSVSVQVFPVRVDEGWIEIGVDQSQ